MRAALVGLSLSLAGACASTPSDYTAQIRVVPGAAARSLWIASKRPPAEEDAGEPVAPEVEDDDAGEGGTDPP
jgi:hypothetical protein